MGSKDRRGVTPRHIYRLNGIGVIGADAPPEWDRGRTGLEALTGLALEPTHRTVRIQRAAHTVYHVRGVPAARMDVLVRSEWPAWDDGLDGLVLTVAEKTGRYDGATRPRLCLTWRPPREAAALPPADLDVYLHDDEVRVVITPDDDGAPAPSWSFGRLRRDLDQRSLAQIAMWHWQRYFRLPLPDGDEVRCIADAWAAEVEQRAADERWSLAAANRAADRLLYAHARAAGWHKCTLRQRERLGIDHGPWVSPQAWEAAVARRWPDYSPTGCGEATLTAARRGHWSDDPPTLDVVVRREVQS